MDNQTTSWKAILFGAGEVGIRVLRQLGNEKVYAFCDNYKAEQMIERKVVIDIAMLKKIMITELYRVIICVTAPHLACEIAYQLRI